MKLKHVLLLLLCAALLPGCHKPSASNDGKPITARTTKSKPSAAVQSDDSSSASSTDEIPLRVSETDSATEGETSSAPATALKSFHPPVAPPSAWKEGVNSRRLSPVQPTSALPGQIE